MRQNVNVRKKQRKENRKGEKKRKVTMQERKRKE
jgi:hypothetical protein